MRNMLRSVLLLAVVLVCVTSCDFTGGSLVGTKWLHETVSGTSSGDGLKVTTSSTGYTCLVILGVWTEQSSFVYTYNPSTKTGTAKIDGTNYTFAITGNNLIDNTGRTYKYTP